MPVIDAVVLWVAVWDGVWLPEAVRVWVIVRLGVGEGVSVGVCVGVAVWEFVTLEESDGLQGKKSIQRWEGGGVKAMDLEADGVGVGVCVEVLEAV